MATCATTSMLRDRCRSRLALTLRVGAETHGDATAGVLPGRNRAEEQARQEREQEA